MLLLDRTPEPALSITQQEDGGLYRDPFHVLCDVVVLFFTLRQPTGQKQGKEKLLKVSFSARDLEEVGDTPTLCNFLKKTKVSPSSFILLPPLNLLLSLGILPRPVYHPGPSHKASHS